MKRQRSRVDCFAWEEEKKDGSWTGMESVCSEKPSVDSQTTDLTVCDTQQRLQLLLRRSFTFIQKMRQKKKVSIEFTWMNDIKDRDPDVTVLSCDWLTCLILHQLLPEHHMVYLMAAEIHVKYVHFTISYLILALRVTGRNTYDIKGILPWMKCSVWFMSNGPTSV